MCIACAWKHHKCFIYSRSAEQKTDKISKGIRRSGKWRFHHCVKSCRCVASQVRNSHLRWFLEPFFCDSDSGPLRLNELQTFTSITLYGTQMGQQIHALSKLIWRNHGPSYRLLMGLLKPPCNVRPGRYGCEMEGEKERYRKKWVS